MIITENGSRSQLPVGAELEFNIALQQNFNIIL